jgi:hypothetical protein
VAHRERLLLSAASGSGAVAEWILVDEPLAYFVEERV